MRQLINRRILAMLVRKYPEYRRYYSKIYQCIEKYPHQRFGQICCNYIFPEYRDHLSTFERDFLTTVFPNVNDPFYEESLTTLKTLYYV